jgi:spore maturation protein CgeB
MNLDARHNAVREAVWSSAMQHVSASIFLKEAVRLADRRAPRGSPDYDAILIKELYAARSRYVSKEAKRKTDPGQKRELQNVVRNRYPEEEKQALLLLER